MNQLPTEPQPLAVTPVTFLAIMLFAARHKAYAQVEPGVMKEVDRIPISVDFEKGIAQVVIDPDLLIHFGRNEYRLAIEEVPIPGAVTLNNKALRLTFVAPRASALVSASGEAPSPDPFVMTQLNGILG
jgi:hypothetical protein